MDSALTPSACPGMTKEASLAYLPNIRKIGLTSESLLCYDGSRLETCAHCQQRPRLQRPRNDRRAPSHHSLIALAGERHAEVFARARGERRARLRAHEQADPADRRRS